MNLDQTFLRWGRVSIISQKYLNEQSDGILQTVEEIPQKIQRMMILKKYFIIKFLNVNY